MRSVPESFDFNDEVAASIEAASRLNEVSQTLAKVIPAIDRAVARSSDNKLCARLVRPSDYWTLNTLTEKDPEARLVIGPRYAANSFEPICTINMSFDGASYSVHTGTASAYITVEPGAGEALVTNLRECLKSPHTGAVILRLLQEETARESSR